MTAPFSQNTYNRPQFHGGDLQWAEAEFGHPADFWLDLSTGINPAPYPVPKISEAAWHRLPAPAAENDLLQAARRFYQVPKPVEICALPGTQAAIQLLPRLFPVCKVDIFSPTYSEHAGCWSGARHFIRSINAMDDVDGDTKIAVLVHPNNPDGRVFPKDAISRLAKELRSRGGWLILDEAFADMDPELSFASELGKSGPIILKSFGKFFGLAGLRLGFLLAPSGIARQVRQELGPWAVSGIAMEVGTQAFDDDEWIDQTRASLQASSQRLKVLLTKAKLTLAGGTALFQLIESADAAALFKHLCKAGILCRIFPDRPGFLRFGLPGAEKDWLRLEAALKIWAKPLRPTLSD